MYQKQLPIIRRSVEIEFNDQNEHAWLAMGNGIEDFLNALSYYFGPSETFFIQSVKHYRNQISEPTLLEKVNDFIYQEAMHTKQHNQCNQAMAHAHPNGPRIEQLIGRILRTVRRLTPASTQLAFTAALEHFYAILSNFLLTYQKEFMRISDPAFSTLWLWHAVEETEHKAVCFDVYRHVRRGGLMSYLNRVLGMLMATLFFLTTLPVALWWIKKDAAPKQPARYVRWALEKLPASRKKIERYSFWRFVGHMFSLKTYFAYYKPTFHPWDHDNSELVAVWKQKFPGRVITEKSGSLTLENTA